MFANFNVEFALDCVHGLDLSVRDQPCLLKDSAKFMFHAILKQGNWKFLLAIFAIGLTPWVVLLVLFPLETFTVLVIAGTIEACFAKSAAEDAQEAIAEEFNKMTQEH